MIRLKIRKLGEKIRVSEKISPRMEVKYFKLENQLKNLESIEQLHIMKTGLKNCSLKMLKKMGIILKIIIAGKIIIQNFSRLESWLEKFLS